MSFGNTTTNSTTDANSQAKTDPWGPAIPYLTNFLQDTDATRANLGPSQDQLDAFAQLKNNVSQGNPFTSQIAQLANDQFGSASNSGQVQDAYKTLQNNLGDYASGKMLDFSSNPYIQQMLKTVGDDTQNRINQMFAGAGRDLSGMNQQTLARGLAQGEAPILSQLYTQEQQNQLNAANALFNAGSGAASEGQQLDQAAQAARAAGINTGNQALNAANYGPNQVLNLDQQLKQMPLNDLSLYASLLLPAAGLGGSQVSHTLSNTSADQNTFGIKL
jgi:hypothetical protein